MPGAPSSNSGEDSIRRNDFWSLSIPTSSEQPSFGQRVTPPPISLTPSPSLSPSTPSHDFFSFHLVSPLAELHSLPLPRLYSPRLSRSINGGIARCFREKERKRVNTHTHVYGARGWPGSPAHGKGGNQRLASRLHGTSTPAFVVYPLERKGMVTGTRVGDPQFARIKW